MVVKENSNNSTNLFNLLLDQKVKVKYIDEGHTKSISGTVKNADSVYLVLERPGGDPMFINHSVVNRIIPLGDIEWEIGKYNNKDKEENGDDGHHIKDVDENKIFGGDENGRRKSRRQNRD